MPADPPARSPTNAPSSPSPPDQTPNSTPTHSPTPPGAELPTATKHAVASEVGGSASSRYANTRVTPGVREEIRGKIPHQNLAHGGNLGEPSSPPSSPSSPNLPQDPSQDPPSPDSHQAPTQDSAQDSNQDYIQDSNQDQPQDPITLQHPPAEDKPQKNLSQLSPDAEALPIFWTGLPQATNQAPTQAAFSQQDQPQPQGTHNTFQPSPNAEALPIFRTGLPQDTNEAVFFHHHLLHLQEQNHVFEPSPNAEALPIFAIQHANSPGQASNHNSGHNSPTQAPTHDPTIPTPPSQPSPNPTTSPTTTGQPSQQLPPPPLPPQNPTQPPSPIQPVHLVNHLDQEHHSHLLTQAPHMINPGAPAEPPREYHPVRGPQQGTDATTSDHPQRIPGLPPPCVIPMVPDMGADLDDHHHTLAHQCLSQVYGDHVHDNAGTHLAGGIPLDIDAKWQRRWRRLVSLPTISYSLPAGKIGRRFVSLLHQELHAVRVTRAANFERVVVFSTTILEKEPTVRRAADIRRRLSSRMDLWEAGQHAALVDDTEALRRGRPSTRVPQDDASRSQAYHNKVASGRLRQAVRHLTSRAGGGVLLPSDTDAKTGRPVHAVLRDKHPGLRVPDLESGTCTAFEPYDRVPEAVPVTVTSEAIERVAARLSGAAGPSGTDAVELKNWLLRYGSHSESLRLELAAWTEWLANGSPPFAAIRALLACRLVALDKQPGVRPVGIGEIMRRLMAKVVLSLTGSTATTACGNFNLCAGLAAGIEGAVHAVAQRTSTWSSNQPPPIPTFHPPTIPQDPNSPRSPTHSIPLPSFPTEALPPSPSPTETYHDAIESSNTPPNDSIHPPSQPQPTQPTNTNPPTLTQPLIPPELPHSPSEHNQTSPTHTHLPPTTQHPTSSGSPLLTQDTRPHIDADNVSPLVHQLTHQLHDVSETILEEEGDHPHPNHSHHPADPEAFLLVDARNGFNELSRLAMLWTIRHRWPNGARFAFNCYRHASQLIMRTPGQDCTMILSREGVTQGDPLSMVLYGLALVPLAESLRRAQPGVLQPWYADDFAMVGPASALHSVMALLLQEGPDRGYYPEPQKSTVVCPPASRPHVEALLARYNFTYQAGSRYVGGFIGTQEARDLWLKPKLEAWHQGITDLAHVATQYPQAAYAGLAHSLQREWHYLQRVIPDVNEAFAPLESALREVFLPALLGEEPGLPDATIVALSGLGTHAAGLGIPNPCTTTAACHAASKAVTEKVTASLLASADLASEAHQAHAGRVRASTRSSRLKEAQANLQTLAAAAPPMDKRRLLRAAKTGQWLQVQPVELNGTVLSKDEFRDSLRLRLGLTPLSLPTRCDGCDAPFNVAHALTCKRGGLITLRHDELRRELHHLCAQALQPAAVRDEPLIHTYRNPATAAAEGTPLEELRGDLSAHGFWQRSITTVFDIRVSDTDAPSYHGRDPQKVLLQQEQEKTRKYGPSCLESRRHFTPMVFSVDGLMGAQAHAATRQLAALLTKKWKRGHADMCNYVRSRLALSLVRSLSMALRHPRDPTARATHPLWDNGSGFQLYT